MSHVCDGPSHLGCVPRASYALKDVFNIFLVKAALVVANRAAYCCGMTNKGQITGTESRGLQNAGRAVSLSRKSLPQNEKAASGANRKRLSLSIPHPFWLSQPEGKPLLVHPTQQGFCSMVAASRSIQFREERLSEHHGAGCSFSDERTIPSCLHPLAY